MSDITILIDTNIVLDWLLEREPFLDYAKRVMEPCIRGEIYGCLASHTLLNVFYITRKQKSIEERKEILLMLCEKFTIIGIDKDMILATLRNKAWDDLEDGLQMHCATVEYVDYIITRDTQDFTSSQVQVLSPEAFIKEIAL